MSVQFGTCNLDGKPVNPEDLDVVRPVLAPLGPDGEGFICRDNFAILYRGFHTTRESHQEVQPHVCPSGVVITWDGRLDNRRELIEKLTGSLSCAITDLEIVAASYQRWDTRSLAGLVGDWALSVWTPKNRTLVLSRDFAGIRHLYYFVEGDKVAWSSTLEPLALFAGHPLELQEECVAGWLTGFPAAHLTPYKGIHSVPPSTFVRLTQGNQSINTYWDFDPAKTIRYRTDGEYEEQFRTVFAESVRRRLRSDSSVLAELSGGIDSSSIVCMADKIAHDEPNGAPRLDTVSYYDDLEPHWNERPYFATIEAQRGRTGCHIDMGRERPFDFQFDNERPIGITQREEQDSTPAAELASYMASHGHRVMLSGIGGDEVTGGVPTPLPELEDLIARAQFGVLARQLRTWALSQRKPWIHLFASAMRRFLPPALLGPDNRNPCAPWMHPHFVERNRRALTCYQRRLRLFGPLPSFQENLSTLEILRGQLGCVTLPCSPTYERRYPYLDRDLLEFVFAVPRAQLVRPGQTRSLMRRALRGIVPEEILFRKRKAYVVRADLLDLTNAAAQFTSTKDFMVSSWGIVDPDILLESLRKVSRSGSAAIAGLTRTLGVELWLRTLRADGFLTAPTSPSPADSGIRRGLTRSEGKAGLSVERKARPLTGRIGISFGCLSRRAAGWHQEIQLARVECSLVHNKRRLIT